MFLNSVICTDEMTIARQYKTRSLTSEDRQSIGMLEKVSIRTSTLLAK
jgi:hypothetical protein